MKSVDELEMNLGQMCQAVEFYLNQEVFQKDVKVEKVKETLTGSFQIVLTSDEEASK